jgi:2-keto-4-pentenoate hydratase/2-oxohepta-3-ene-1,7-dioic acid hydratase in catechol pathway
MGLILCNDYTDRQTLLRNINIENVASGEGFTTGKSAPGYLPVGELFVIPRDHRAFAAARELALAVNGETRQRAAVSTHVWDIDRILEEVWERRDVRWQNGGGQVALLTEGNVLPARTLVMAGTPAGTVFQGIGMRHRAHGIARWIFGGFDRPVAETVIETYIGDPAVRAHYLQPGDRVTIQVEYLGTIDNPIVP